MSHHTGFRGIRPRLAHLTRWKIIGPAVPPLAALLLATMAPSAPAKPPPETLTSGAHYRSARLYFQQKLLDRAEAQLRLALAADSACAGCWTLWGKIACEEAWLAVDATPAMTDTAVRLEALRNLAPLYEQAGLRFSRAEALDPEEEAWLSRDWRQHYWVTLFKLADNLFNIRRYAESLEMFRLLERLDPAEPYGLLYQAYCLDRQQQVREAVRLARSADDLAQRRLAASACDTLEGEARRSTCRHLQDQHTRVRSGARTFLEGRIAALGDLARAEADADSVPVNRRAHLEEAISRYEEALRSAPDRPEVRFKLARAFFSMAETFQESSDTALVHSWYRRSADTFLDLAGAGPPAARAGVGPPGGPVGAGPPGERAGAEARHGGVEALRRIGDWARLLPWLKVEVDEHPGDGTAWRDLGECLAELKQPGEAFNCLLTARVLSEEGRETPLAESLLLLGNPAAASDPMADLKSLGEPGTARTCPEPGSDRIIVGWFWWSRGEARHYVGARRIGRVQFRATP